ncbi:type VII secretion-associated serine protease mycosin [Stackebrandtia albiflava]|uniref:Type VII secretion-associated serine protease mycosin n=1 Tax=Stackebrandtia albiflava TaxID=406432 RepID=A0A562URX2_9ACTN|nr:type VII secretion-associated serine protease mycosin [Stackebrandtia albiflava]TWJ08366.1 type VII secretion-associated serine protease mycosin [Stackebrandtia albiflava]
MRLMRGFLVVLAAVAGLTVPAFPAWADSCDLGDDAENTLQTLPWGLRSMSTEALWPLARGEGQTVAVIDSGVSDRHPVLAGAVDEGDDYTGEGKGGRCDESGHGTLIAGIIAGRPDPETDFAGMAPAARVYAVRLLRDTTRVSDEQVPIRLAAAIREAVDHGASVLNLSYEGTHHRDLRSAVEYAIAENVVVVAAAGNQRSSPDEPPYPAAYDGVLAVANVDESGQRASQSSAGNHVDVAAPGEGVVGPGRRGEGYSGDSGTSYSTAFVSGLAALLRSHLPELSAADVVDRIVRTAQHPPQGWNPEVGHGIIDPYRAMTADLSNDTTAAAGEAPRIRWEADRGYAARSAAGRLLAVAVVAVVLVAAGRAVLPRVRGRSARPADQPRV